MKKIWTVERIKEGFEQFITDNQRLPTSGEIDTSGYLPSSRYIQKRFGGLEKLRLELGYTDVHLGHGDFRGRIATEAGQRSKILKEDMQSVLYTKFGHDSVESEKAFCGRQRVDFYIYTPAGNFGIDIFYAETMRTLQSSVNIKMKRYQEFKELLYLTVANEDFKQTELDTYAKNKNNPLPPNIHLVSLPTLRKKLKSLLQESSDDSCK